MARRRGKRTSNTRARVASKPKHRRIALIGFRGVGKSAIGRRLSEFWQMPLIALDEHVEKNAGKRIEQIVKDSGWQHFRDLEYAALQQASTMDEVLLDCGGGIVEEADGSRSDRKIQLLRQNFFCVYISASEEKLIHRLRALARNASRPDLTGADSPEALIQIFRRREPWYLELAHAVVDVSDTNVTESAFRITQMFK